ncbi:flagellar basal body P-ring formation chaperone FlgA [uncultured Phenylobacterium sp.]|uniref:flagellar basal body P-ring formation chaperone FlgA n=1 Tax=uncultured Phenylobacterium sp. TaxID=349273 RepID=UPI0025DAF860|nr:flagellar basal body P-ring formation chaperone FlgA [uncultured Phenylobacterium sp.]
MKAIATLAALLVATPAFAGAPVTLKTDAFDADGVVTLGEIFDGAGAAGRTPVASRTGNSVMLNAQAVRLAAARAGLDWANAEGLRQIVVRSGAPTGLAGPAAARGNIDILTWARSISAGEVIRPADLVWGKAATAPADAPSDPDMMVGQAARRALRAGAAVTGRDVAALQVVKANEIVTLVYENGGVSLSLQAKALSGGAVGETINVQNVTSKKTVQAVVTGPGQAAVGPAAEQLKLPRSTRVALR